MPFKGPHALRPSSRPLRGRPPPPRSEAVQAQVTDTSVGAGVWLRLAVTAFAALALAWLAAASPAFAQTGDAGEDGTIRIVGFGDSLMAGYDLGPDEGFVPTLQRELDALGIDAEVIQAGVSGDTTTGGLARLDWSVPSDADIVIVELGGNDALRGIEPDVTRANLDAIVNALRVRDQRVVLAGILAPPNMGADYENRFNPIYADVARERDVPLYPFFLDGAITVPGLMLADGIHPSPAGVEVMVERFLPTLLPVIEQVRAERGLVPGPDTTPPLDPGVPAAVSPAPAPEQPASPAANSL